MPNARITIKSMEKYLNDDSKSITDTWDLTTPSDLYDKDTLLYTIFNRGGSLEPIEYDPDEFYDDCEYFWNKWKRTIEKWVVALETEYNPLENYDRQESWTDERESEGSDSQTRSSTEITDDDTTFRKTGTETSVVDGENTSDSTTEEKVSAFDASNYVPSKETVTHSEGTEDTTNTLTYNTTDTGTDDKTVTTSESSSGTNGNTESGTHTGRIHGNIGVTTSQAMLKSELDLQYWNLYNHVADLFINELTTRVY